MVSRGTRVDDPSLPIVLTPSALVERAKELARIDGECERLENDLTDWWKDQGKERARRQKEIDQRRAQAYRLAATIRRQEEFRDQSTLKFDEDPTKGGAATERTDGQVLGELGAIVEGPKAEEFDENNPPTACRKCGKGVKPLMAGLTCEDSADGGACDWLARPAGKTLAGEVIKPVCETCGGTGKLPPLAEGDAAGVESPCACVATEASVPEAEEEDVRPRCKNPACEVVLTAMEVVRKLGVCEECEAIWYTEDANDVDGNVAEETAEEAEAEA